MLVLSTLAQMAPAWRVVCLLALLSHVKSEGDVSPDLPGAVVTESACEGSQAEWGLCPLSSDCPEPEVVDCQFNDWSAWSGCDCTGLKMRERNIATHNNVIGDPCGGALIETASCTPHCHADPTNCTLGDWSDWEGECKTWDAQKTKTRDLAQSPLNGGSACEGPLSSTVPCGTKPPAPVAVNCKVHDWDKWGDCSVTCGPGEQTRSRSIKQHAENGGEACESFLEEIASCENATCPDVEECVWADWSDYSACTCSCGGGQQTRYRGIKNAPKHGGAMCDSLPKSEISPCHTQSCGECVDGEWGDWNEWEKCSADCDGGISLRTRTVAQTANSCGTPVSGPTTEAMECNTQLCHEDEHMPCVFSVWSDWSDCSCTCNGVKRRARSIKSYGTGTGASCEGPLGEVEPCNIGDTAPAGCHAEPAVDCVMGAWKEWGVCSATCDGGQNVRYREIETYASGGGTPCTGSTSHGTGCKTDPCEGPEPVPCQWQDWSEWGACDKCGGQKKRFRHVAQMPENNGAACDQAGSEETEGCSRDCGVTIFCSWQDWGEWSACPDQVCTKYKRERKRILMATNEEPTLTQAKFEDLQMEHTAMKSDRLRDLVVSFACGLFTFAAMVTGVRVFAPKRTNVAP